MSKFDHLAPVLSKTLDLEVVVGPALTSVGVGGLDDETYVLISAEAKRLTRPEALRLLPHLTIQPSMLQQLMLETLSSTAAYLSHLRLGYLNVDESMVRVAARLVDEAMKNVGVDEVLTVMVAVCYYDNAQVLIHYGSVPKPQFVSGELHRPWIHYTLDEELQLLVESKTAEVVDRDGEQHVQLTEYGLSRYNVVREFLTNTGFLARRTSLMRLSRFSQMTDYDELIQRIFSMPLMHQDLLQHSSIKPGMNVLELGCGTGGFTIDSGLYKLVGQDGELVATEPSYGMLTRARNKGSQVVGGNVKFLQMRAEELSFEDNTFDVVIGAAFLHLTEIDKAIREIHRVLKPGGLFVTAFPLSFPHAVSFFTDWFKPVLSLSEPSSTNRDSLPERDTVRNLMSGLFEGLDVWEKTYTASYTDPEGVVRFYFQAVNAFDEAMSNLPWKAREDLTNLLIERGRHIVASYPTDQLQLQHPIQFVYGHAVK